MSSMLGTEVVSDVEVVVGVDVVVRFEVVVADNGLLCVTVTSEESPNLV